jgi:hypothetical protein
MGISLAFLAFLDSCHRQQALQSPFLSLGSLEIHESEDDIISFARKHSYAELARNKSLRTLFLDRYGIELYQDCDINKKADIDCDLSLPINQELIGVASTILDGGTLEHVFDVKQAFINIHNLLKIGGTIIHISPITWLNHAFYNFNPKLFQSVIEANKYELLVEAFMIPQTMRRGISRKKIQRFYLTFDGKEYLDVKRTVQELLNNYSIPANVLYMVAYRKERNEDFRSPYDI